MFTAAYNVSYSLARDYENMGFHVSLQEEKNSSDVDPTNKEATQLALHVQRTFPVYVVLNHRRKCSPQCAAAPWIWNHVGLTSSAAPVEQFLEITIA